MPETSVTPEAKRPAPTKTEEPLDQAVNVDIVKLLEDARGLQGEDRVRAVQIAEKMAAEESEKAFVSGDLVRFREINAAVRAGEVTAEGELTAEKLTRLSNNQLVFAIREMAVDYIDGTEDHNLLSRDKVLDKIVLKVGPRKGSFKAVDLFRDQSGQPRQIDIKVGREKERVTLQSVIEDEIDARCNLKSAQLKEQDLQSMKLGIAQEVYKDMVTKGTVDHVQNETLDFLASIPRDHKEAVEKGDKSKPPLTRRGIDRSFQLLHLAGDITLRLNSSLSEEEKEKLLKRGPAKEDGSCDVEGLTKVCGDAIKQRWGVKDDLVGWIEDAVKAGKSFYDSGDDEAVKRVDDLKKRLEKAYGEDAASLAWQLFQGLRCEGMYFSGHYLGNLVLFDQGRNFACKVLDIWGGSKHGQFAIFKEKVDVIDESGREKVYRNVFVDSEGNPIPSSDYERLIALKSRKVTKDVDGRWVRDYEETKENLQDGYEIPLKDAYIHEGELASICTAPLSQTVEVIEGEKKVKGDYYRRWVLSGSFLENVGRGRRGKKTIEQKNSTNITTALDFKDALKKVKDLGGGGDKGSKIGAAIDALTAVKKLGVDLVDSRIVDYKGMRKQLFIEIENALWELGANNILNVGGSQGIGAPEFLRPSDYNKLFERFSIVSAGATALMDSNNDLVGLRGSMLRWRKLSMRRLKVIAGINASEDEKKILRREEEAMKMVLPERLGEKVLSPSDKFVSSFDESVARFLGQK